MCLRLLLPALAAMVAALPAQDAGQQPSPDTKENKMQMSFDFGKDADTDQVNSVQMKMRGVDQKTGKPFSVQMGIDVSDIEKAQPDAIADRVSLAHLRRKMNRLLCYNEGTKDILRALKERRGGRELRQQLINRKGEFVALMVEMQQLAVTAEAQGVKFPDEPGYAAVMCVYNRLIAEQCVEIELLSSEVTNMEWPEEDKDLPVAYFLPSVSISAPAVRQADLEKQVPALTQRAYSALAEVGNMLSMISDADSAESIVAMLAERVHEVDKCRRLIERYLNNVPSEVVQGLQPATAETLRAAITRVSAPVIKAKYFGCKRLEELYEVCNWLQDAVWSMNIPVSTLPNPDQVNMEVDWSSDKDSDGEEKINKINISVQESEGTAAPEAEPPAEAKE